MGIFDKLFGKKLAAQPASGGMDEHLVRLHIPLDGDFGNPDQIERWNSLEDVLNEAAEASGTGSLDGNEIGGGEYTIWLYGKAGGPLADVVERAAREFVVPPGTTLFVRHGGVEDRSAREETREVN